MHGVFVLHRCHLPSSDHFNRYDTGQLHVCGIRLIPVELKGLTAELMVLKYHNLTDTRLQIMAQEVTDDALMHKKNFAHVMQTEQLGHDFKNAGKPFQDAGGFREQLESARQNGVVKRAMRVIVLQMFHNI